MNRTRHRRLGGGLLLVALIGAVVVPTIIGPGVTGRAAVAPAPPPPVVGDCLRDPAPGYAVSGAGDLKPSAPVIAVPCAAPHGGEIVRMELSLPTAVGPDVSQPFDAFVRRCWDDTAARWPSAYPTTDDWSPRLNLAIGVFGPDRQQRAAGQSWVGCTAGPLEGTIDRPLAALATGAGPPPLLGRCSRWQSGSDSAVTVACTQPHTVEEIGLLDLERGSSRRQDELAASCVALVVAATGRPTLPADPALAIDTSVSAFYDSGDTSPVLAPLPSGAAGGRVTCSVRVVDDRSLTMSLRRIGDAALPWTS